VRRRGVRGGRNEYGQSHDAHRRSIRSRARLRGLDARAVRISRREGNRHATPGDNGNTRALVHRDGPFCRANRANAYCAACGGSARAQTRAHFNAAPTARTHGDAKTASDSHAAATPHTLSRRELQSLGLQFHARCADLFAAGCLLPAFRLHP